MTRWLNTTGALEQSQRLASLLTGDRKLAKYPIFAKYWILAVFITFLLPLYSHCFSFLTHEAIIDNTWEKSIRPLLKIKYPRTTDSALQVAHSYAYGGAVFPDIGYTPLGSVFFTNLIHYVNTGDFINALLDEAEDVNEYAFALGVLSHYFTDVYGHPFCTNHAVPMLYPEVKEKLGNIVTFEQAEREHSRTEYGFDVIQTAIGNYKSEDYHSFIGFQVSQPVLERAFLKTYKLELKDIFLSLPVSISLFRFSVNNIFPELTKDAWRIRKSFLTKLNPLEGEDEYDYKIDKDAYEKEFGKIPILSTILSFFIGLVPKVGPWDVYKFKEPSPEVEMLFAKTMKTISIRYSKQLKKLAHTRPRLENINYDTGKKTVPKDYKLADVTYEELIRRQNDK
jgi:hypothetical protein